MKHLIIGLGNFGKTLACTLTDQGDEVIGVDTDEHRVEAVKDKIAVAYIMDATETLALKSLPLEDLDSVIVAIGQSMEASLRTVVALKELQVPKIYARALDETHLSILRAMSIKNIFIPENYAARTFAKQITAGPLPTLEDLL